MRPVPCDLAKEREIEGTTCENLRMAVINDIAVASEVSSAQTLVSCSQGDDRQIRLGSLGNNACKARPLMCLRFTGAGDTKAVGVMDSFGNRGGACHD